MGTALRVGLVGLICLAAAGAAVVALLDPGVGRSIERTARGFRTAGPADDAPAAAAAPPTSDFPAFSSTGFENAGYPTASRYTGDVRDRSSLEETREALRTRGRRGIRDQLAALAAIPKGSPDTAVRTFQARCTLALLHMYEGEFPEAADRVEQALSESDGFPEGLRMNLGALLGVIHLRRGETENCLDCLGPSSCIFPISAEAVHQKPSGSREAVRRFTAYLEKRPDDLGVRWLLNVAHMTLGTYPAGVPEAYRLPLAPFLASADVGRFENVAATAGLGARGVNMAGGSVFDDFDGDGRPDLFATSFDTGRGASLFVNKGDGTFDDRSSNPGLAEQGFSVNASQADFDNDGRLDVVLVRGGWENPLRLSLLRNTGGGAFEDVTVAAGLAEPIASHSAAWGDFDNDGRLDLFVCGEYASGSGAGLFSGQNGLGVADPRNRCRLYRNNGDGTFEDVAPRAGVTNERYAKGAAWGDYDGDGRLDLYVSNFGGGGRLYHNRGDGTFEDVAPEVGATGPDHGFSCWFWDYDNDGRLDLFVNDYSGDLHDVVAGALGQKTRSGSHPRLLRNLGHDGFRDVSAEAGLTRPVLAMGAGFGDVDNDGFLDAYLATGTPGYSGLMPNVLLHNAGGKRFEDATTSSGTGHLQKGHGVSFADYDADGDLDLFVETGGAVPGDKAANLLFRNPGHGRHWLKVKLVGTRTNRSALGARIRVDVDGPDGKRRSVHRQVGGGASYGGNGLVEHVGLGDAGEAASVTVEWPVSGTRQKISRPPVDRTIELTEGAEGYRVVPAPPGGGAG